MPQNSRRPGVESPIEIGPTGVAYGFWRFAKDDIEPAGRILEVAREAGIVHLDTADIYGVEQGFGSTEEMLGALRRQAPSLFEGATIATKIGIEPGAPYNSSRTRLLQAASDSLRRLQVEQVDLLYVHRPDLLAHPEEVAGALDDIVARGLAARIGVSNHSVGQIAGLRRYLATSVAAHQIELSLKYPAPIENGLLDDAMANGDQVFAWSPLGGGDLLADGSSVGAEIRRLAADFGTAPSAIALAFIMAHPARPAPILGTRTPARLHECLAASGIKLSRPQWYRLYEAAIGRKMP